MNSRKFEFFVGFFVLLGIASLAFLSLRVARNELFTAGGYDIQAVFSNCSGLRPGCSIMIAGVEVGRVKAIDLENFEAKATLTLQPGITLSKDAIASIKTKGLIGEKYVEITQGSDEKTIAPGGRLFNTEPAMDIEGLISKYVQGSVTSNGPSGADNSSSSAGNSASGAVSTSSGGASSENSTPSSENKSASSETSQQSGLNR